MDLLGNALQLNEVDILFRFDQKKWFRYDDTVVTETLENFVRYGTYE